MAGIRSRAKAARSLAQDMAELSRPARHPLLPDWPQNLRQPRPPRYPPPPPPRRCKEHHLSLRLKKSLQWVMPNMFYNIFNDTPRHNPLPFQIFYVIMNCPYAVRLRMKPERGRYFYLTGFNLWIAIWRLMIFHLISNPLSYVEHMDTNR